MISLNHIRQMHQFLAPYVLKTPVWRWQTRKIEQHLGPDSEIWLKLELFQHTGTFKARGALGTILALTPEQLARGVTAISAGNHAIAVSYAAAIAGTTAKVVMPQSAIQARVARCREYGAEVVLTADIHAAFEKVKEIEQEEGRFFVHPFEGERISQATATIGLEFHEQVGALDAIVIPIGGGGLASGIAAAIKQLQPDCRVYGVEPEGADTMHRSFASGRPESIDKVRTIADSLGAPYAMPYSLALCQEYIDELVMISDAELKQAMRLLFDDMKLACEPAGAATTAALLGPLREPLRSKKVGLIVCGSNIDIETFAQLVNPSGLNTL